MQRRRGKSAATAGCATRTEPEQHRDIVVLGADFRARRTVRDDFIGTAWRAHGAGTVASASTGPPQSGPAGWSVTRELRATVCVSRTLSPRRTVTTTMAGALDAVPREAGSSRLPLIGYERGSGP